MFPDSHGSSRPESSSLAASGVGEYSVVLLVPITPHPFADPAKCLANSIWFLSEVSFQERSGENTLFSRAASFLVTAPGRSEKNSSSREDRNEQP